eukprot:193770-Rhodomonas_salina.3
MDTVCVGCSTTTAPTTPTDATTTTTSTTTTGTSYLEQVLENLEAFHDLGLPQRRLTLAAVKNRTASASGQTATMHRLRVG